MPVKIQNITQETKQRHKILFLEEEVDVIIQFLPLVQSWTISVEYKQRNTYGIRLALGTLHMESRNYPFGFLVRDMSDTGLDPFKIDDFEAGRCELIMLLPDDMAQVRGAPVEI